LGRVSSLIGELFANKSDAAVTIAVPEILLTHGSDVA
jgi:hypothetical protein